MTPNYTTRDLIELSLLDAMGLLDDSERDGFESAFAGTSPAIQAHIRREQTRLAHIDFLLPDVEPPADLRSLVLEAVRRAMAEGAEKVAARAAFVPAMLPSRRVSSLWRAGAVGFATAAVVFGYTTIQMSDQYKDLQNLLDNNKFVDQTMATLGGSFQEFIFDENSLKVVFRPTSKEVKGMAALLLNNELGQASLICQNFPSQEGREYKLVVLNDAGGVAQQLTAFTASGLTRQAIKVTLSNGQRLAILPPSDPGQPEPAPIFMTDPLRI